MYRYTLEFVGPNYEGEEGYVTSPFNEIELPVPAAPGGLIDWITPKGTYSLRVIAVHFRIWAEGLGEGLSKTDEPEAILRLEVLGMHPPH